mmetsp:Transcript_29302/g.61073  ORF Transcript_29302/g.61073 Transcript_29302/m.61073 type:complete len:97 (+) Transcript_29302:150-440(+)
MHPDPCRWLQGKEAANSQHAQRRSAALTWTQQQPPSRTPRYFTLRSDAHYPSPSGPSLNGSRQRSPAPGSAAGEAKKKLQQRIVMRKYFPSFFHSY